MCAPFGGFSSHLLQAHQQKKSEEMESARKFHRRCSEMKRTSSTENAPTPLSAAAGFKTEFDMGKILTGKNTYKGSKGTLIFLG